MSKPKLLVLHGERHFNRPTHAESPAVRERFEVTKATTVTGKPDLVFCQSYAQSFLCEQPLELTTEQSGCQDDHRPQKKTQVIE